MISWKFACLICDNTIGDENMRIPYPPLGGSPSQKQKQLYRTFDNYANGKFMYPVPTKISMKIPDIFSMMKESRSAGKERKPSGRIPVEAIDWNQIQREENSLIWFGHSAFFLSIDHIKILIDPMLGPVASPVAFAGSKRYSEDLLRLIDEMPPIDAVLITHDHYDHLDYPSIVKLRHKVGHFFVPHGVGAHLLRWGIKAEQITELNWWDKVKFQDLTFIFTPSKHFSGRGLHRNSTLWGGWIIQGKHRRIYTSGDGGYDKHFKEIGAKYGPFDLTLMEGAQYDRRWSWAHMTPEEAVQAHLDVQGKNMMLIHWGAFTLAFHGWKEPIERALTHAEKMKVNIITPAIGETVLFTDRQSSPNFGWWSNW